MKRWSMVALILLLSIGIMTGCQGQSESEELEMYAKTDSMRLQVKEEGLFFIDGYTMLMTFYDFDLDQKIPLCDKPNCPHDSNECNAFVMYAAQSGMNCYQNKLYFFDITDSEFPFYQADKNGANRKVLTTLADKANGVTVWMPMFFVGDYVYFQMDFNEFLSEPVVQEDGTIKGMESMRQFARIHLETGEFEKIMEPQVSDQYTLRECTEEVIIYKSEYQTYIYDLESHQSRKILKDEYSYLGFQRKERKIYYHVKDDVVSKVYTLDIETGEEEFVFETARNGMFVEWRLVGENLYYSKYFYGESNLSGEMGVYNLSNKTEQKLSEEQYKYSPLQETSEWYITYTEEGLVCISKEAYENQEWDKIQVIGAF